MSWVSEVRKGKKGGACTLGKTTVLDDDHHICVLCSGQTVAVRKEKGKKKKERKRSLVLMSSPTSCRCPVSNTCVFATVMRTPRLCRLRA
ncbi:Os04g0649000 [Oryza sativa Japonica Group]|uniref:Os04g0649000 protein n=3 Tax=Oryza TaxID=4527 RepID=C7J1Y1_ORYSJ|nr:hypothetical protein OsJ_16419 [Oryza sativa Japonica Group]KAB8097241.1 hypothetical protein EE612_025942 [Oryza sativa]BAH92850.1 Os04g0649001 [Oryza sativa Japonica Group]BAS91334.1 Os04g0649000 [Oryza sativa Japonica Group]|eukprot:NP_001174122.1 Os04g0649001 [Oryza sativa Japonica Group]